MGKKRRASRKKLIKPHKTISLKKDLKQKKINGLLENLISFKDPDSSQPAFRNYFFGSLVLLAAITITLSVISGINADDSWQNEYSDKITSFYTSFGKDTSCFNTARGEIKYYGGLFELMTGSINQTLGFEVTDRSYHLIRHVINALFGFTAMFFVALWLKLIGGWQAALIGLWICFLSPRFLGHSLMNPKDIPFASGYIMAIYFIARLMREYPRLTNKSLVGLLLGIGIAFGVRAGALVLITYILLFFGIQVLNSLLQRFPKGIWADAIKPVTILAFFVLGGLAFGTLFWPYALIDPLNHIPEALSGFTNFEVGIKLLFQGEMMYGTEVPWYYHLVWLKNTVPLTVFLGLALLVVHIKQWVKNYGFLDLFLGAFCFAFPLIYVIAKKSNLYDGWRHVLFTYLPLVFLASGSWFLVFKLYWSKLKIRIAMLAVLGLTALEPALFIIRNPYFPYVYFNPVTGGIRGAFGKFETDYWGVSTQQAARWMEKEGIIHQDMKDTITIASNFSYNINNYLTRYPNVRVTYVRYRERHTIPWDYGIFNSRFVSGKHLQEGIWPPKTRLINSITANGVPLAGILKNGDDKTFRAIQANEAGDHQLAIEFLRPELEDHPDNEIAWIELGTAYQKLGDFTNAENCFKEALLIDPHSLSAYNFLALTYLQSNREAEAVSAFEASLEFENRNSFGLYYLAYINRMKGNLQGALEYALNAIRVNPTLKQAYALTAQIYGDMGDSDRAEVYRRAAEQL